MRKVSVQVLCAAIAAVASMPVLANDYAASIYNEYASASGDALKFDLKVMQTGALSELAGRPLSDFVGTPSYSLQAENAGLSLKSLSLAPVDLKSAYLADLNLDVAKFSDAGYPVETGTYRLLRVSFSDGKQKRSHTAVETCFSSGMCAVFDPSVEFIDSEVKNLRSLQASGWAVQEHSEPANPFHSSGDSHTKAVHCGLASNPKNISRYWTAGSRTVTYKNLLQITMVGKNIGGAQWGMRCDASCNPAPFGYANSSSGWSNIPFSVACDNETNSGKSGKSAKFIAKTGCSHRTVLGASFNLSKGGAALGVTININSQGSVDSNGGSTTDTCGMFN